MLAPHRPIYTIEAEATLPNGVSAHRGALITIEETSKHVRIERTFSLTPTNSR